ncbi:hypothetical protein FRB99_005424 [Tulasnella sp. 403]|nr:hypothetical protein FRB99_005424 [Tulasnella sp. 403]
MASAESEQQSHQQLDNMAQAQRILQATSALMDSVMSRNGEKRRKVIMSLPRIDERDILDPEETCPICTETFHSIVAVEEMAEVMETPGIPPESLGVVRLGCGHRFCRKDLLTWVDTHDTCPLCRMRFEVPAPANIAEMDEEIHILEALMTRLNRTIRLANHMRENTQTPTTERDATVADGSRLQERPPRRDMDMAVEDMGVALERMGEDGSGDESGGQPYDESRDSFGMYW